MKFEISRTSLLLKEEKPCEGAEEIIINEHKYYIVDFEILENLIEFINRNNGIILDKISSLFNLDYQELKLRNINYSIEIYDDYRE